MATVDGQWAKDQLQRKSQGITTVPTGSSVFVAAHTLAAGEAITWLVTITPSTNKALSLWNLAFDVLIDSNASYTYTWPWGSNIDSDLQMNIRVLNWQSLGKSDDTINKRVWIVRIENNDIVSHSTYLYFKAYTISSSVGVAGS